MADNYLFIDGSVNPQLKIGVGGFGLISSSELSQRTDKLTLREKIVVHRFYNTSSTKLELENLLFSVNIISERFPDIVSDLKIVTDSQCIEGLLRRREKLENAAFISRGGKELNNSLGYKKFYDYFDKFNFEIIKIKGHKKSELYNEFDFMFSILDRAVRKELKNWTEEIKKDVQN